MTDFLEQVVRERRAYVAAMKATRPLEEVMRGAQRAAFGRGTVGFTDSLRHRRRDGRLAVIAEVKRTSPAVGHLAETLDPARLAHQYQMAGAAAISVLVEPYHWGGSLRDVSTVSAAVRTFGWFVGSSYPDYVALPVLAKDVVVDEYQIAQAGEAGAHAVLLIAEAFDEMELVRLVDVARELGMDALVEAHGPAAFARAVTSGADAIGVNARDLREPSHIDRRRIHELASEVLPEQLLIAESGITSVQDAEALPPRVDAVLVGTALVRASDPAPLIRALADVRPARLLA